MALQIEDPESVAESESRRISPEAVVRQAMADGQARTEAKLARITQLLEEKVWPHIPTS